MDLYDKSGNYVGSVDKTGVIDLGDLLSSEIGYFILFPGLGILSLLIFLVFFPIKTTLLLIHFLEGGTIEEAKESWGAGFYVYLLIYICIALCVLALYILLHLFGVLPPTK